MSLYCLPRYNAEFFLIFIIPLFQLIIDERLDFSAADFSPILLYIQIASLPHYDYFYDKSDCKYGKFESGIKRQNY